MARIGSQQTSFVAGELSPRLYGRVDLQKYAAGAETGEAVFFRANSAIPPQAMALDQRRRHLVAKWLGY